MRRILKINLILVAVVMMWALGAVQSAYAQPGTLIQNVNLPIPGTGVSVGVDCEGVVYYTNEGDDRLISMDKDGNLIGTVNILDSVTGAQVFIDEISWDEVRQMFWGVEHASNPVDVYLIDPLTGTATFQFQSATISVGDFRDGIALDSTNDTLWISGDISTTIEHYNSAGSLLNTITPTNAAGGTLGNISGVMVGVRDLLYLGQNGLVQIVQVQKSNGGFISLFASPGGARDEGLECDTVNFATLALWSREFDSPGFISAIEIEQDTCVCGGEPTPIPTLSEWGLIIMAGILGIIGVMVMRRRKVAA